MSTEIAAHAYAENIMRLQASLKKKSRDMVQSKLILLAMVPEIIKTLKMYFGRPEHPVLSKALNEYTPGGIFTRRWKLAKLRPI